MNTITGKVILKESGEGIPNLSITIYDLDPETDPEEIISVSGDTTTINSPSLPNLGDRVGSVLTNDVGEFELALEDSEFRIRNEQEKRPDYLLMVLAPEEQGKDLNSRLLYVSSGMIRQNAGRVESYFIRLTEEQLKKAELAVPADSSTESQNVIARMVDVDLAGKAIASKVLELQKERLEVVRKTTKEFDEKIKPELVRTLSFVSGRTRLSAETEEANPIETKEAKNLVLPGQSINKATVKVIREGIAGSFNEDNTLTGFIGISPRDLPVL